jgi:hypothetical protein
MGQLIEQSGRAAEEIVELGRRTGADLEAAQWSGRLSRALLRPLAVR